MDILGKNIKDFVFKAVFVFMLFIFVLPVLNFQRENEWTERNFDVQVNNKEFPDIDVDRTVLPTLKKGDLVTITRRMRKSDCEEKFLVFKTYSSVVKVYWNGKKVYSYGEERYKKNKFLGSGYHIIKLSKVVTAHPVLTVQLKAGENINYDWMEFFKLTKSNTIWTDIFYESSDSVMLSIALIITGSVGFLCFSLVSTIMKLSNDYLLFSFAMAFFVGIWSACTNGVFQNMTGNLELTSAFEYAALYSIPYFYINLIESIKSNLGKWSIVFKLKYFYLAFLAIAALSHIFNIYNISKFVSIFRASVFFVLLFILVISIKGYKQQKSYEKVLGIGNIVSAVLLGIQVVLFNLNIHYINVFHRRYTIGDIFIVIPIIIVIMTPLISYSVSAQLSKDYEMQISLLQNLAYQDSLTGLYNRHKGMAFAIELKKNENQYSIIMMDLNNLKIINDTFGHDRGDKLLVDFSNCLKETFDTDEFLNIRQGGDEFLVVSKFVDETILKQYIEKLANTIHKVNEEINDGCNISVAYGIAKSYEVGNENYDSVLQLADKRMYANKEKMKARMKKNGSSSGVR